VCSSDLPIQAPPITTWKVKECASHPRPFFPFLIGPAMKQRSQLIIQPRAGHVTAAPPAPIVPTASRYLELSDPVLHPPGYGAWSCVCFSSVLFSVVHVLPVHLHSCVSLG